MSNHSTGDVGTRFVATLFLLSGLSLITGIFFWWSHSSDDLVAEVPLAELEQSTEPGDHLASTFSRRTPQPAYEPFKVIRKKPDFSVADAEDKAAEKQQKQIRKMIRRARKLVDGKEYAAAIDTLRQLVEEYPDHQIAWMELGIAHLFHDFNLEAARLAFQKAIELNPNDKNAHEAIKNVYVEMNDRPGGIHFLEKLAARHPHADRIQRTLAYLKTR